MEFRIARASAATGRLLEQLVRAKLTEQNITAPDCVVCYGSGYSGSLPALNASCSTHSKLEQARLLREGLGPGALEVFSDSTSAIAHLSGGRGPLFARSLVHSQGKDIRLALEPWQVEPLLASGSSFFTSHVPSSREYRTWVYRNRHLGTYEKCLRRPEQCRFLGRNHRNGFDFSGVERDATPEGLKEISRRALSVLGLDFGAVDVLQTLGDSFVVLEVNSAPGVSDERRRVIRGLAHRVVRWVATGCPRRAHGGSE